jgi:hypothetical protein
MVLTSQAGGGKVVELAGGYYFGCARFEDGRVGCWGNNERGQIGNGTRTVRTAPTVVWTGPATAPPVFAAQVWGDPFAGDRLAPEHGARDGSAAGKRERTRRP